MIRVDPDFYEASLKKKGVRPMDFTGKVLKGFLLVDPSRNRYSEGSETLDSTMPGFQSEGKVK